MTKCLKESTRQNCSFLCIGACVKGRGGEGGEGSESNQKFLHVGSRAIFWNSTLLIKFTDLIILSMPFYIVI